MAKKKARKKPPATTRKKSGGGCSQIDAARKAYERIRHSADSVLQHAIEKSQLQAATNDARALSAFAKATKALTSSRSHSSISHERYTSAMKAAEHRYDEARRKSAAALKDAEKASHARHHATTAKPEARLRAAMKAVESIIR
jgi:hypothetical protein